MFWGRNHRREHFLELVQFFPGDPESEQQAVGQLGVCISYRICPQNTGSKISFLNQLENQKRRQFLIRCVGVLEESEMNFLPLQSSSKGTEKRTPGEGHFTLTRIH